MKRTAWLALALILTGLQTGCVTRRYVITSNPPGAIVFRDGQPIGATPVEESFIYYGKYRFRLVADGKQPLDVEVDLQPPWYQWPFVDFVAENMIPHTFRDVKPLHFDLQEVETVRHDDVRNRAEWLRERGKTIQPPPGIQLPPRRQPAPTLPPPMEIRPETLPPGTPIPPGAAPPISGSSGGVPFPGQP